MHKDNCNIMKELIITWEKFCEHVGWYSDVPGKIEEGYMKNMILLSSQLLQGGKV